jgi:hypothetical protein
MADSADPRHVVVVTLETQSSEASAVAVATTMQAVVALLEGAQKHLTSDQSLIVKARPFEAGSLEVVLELVLVGGTLLFPDHPLFQTILSIIAEYIAVRKTAEGKPLPAPGKTDGVVISGDITISNSVVTLLTNNDITALVGKASSALQADETITGIAIKEGEDHHTIATIPRAALPYFEQSPSAPTVQKQSKERKRKKVTVIVHTSVLEGNSKWKFIYEGHTISADIQDQAFMAKVNAGEEAFAAGDRLVVDLKVVEEYDVALAAFQIASYFVMKVHSHSKRPTNTLFPLDKPVENSGDRKDKRKGKKK